MQRIEDRFDDDFFIRICNESESMAKAAAELGIHFNSFKRRAVKLGCYKPNQPGKGITKNATHGYPLKDILNGKHPQYSTFKLKNKLLREGIKNNVCERCGISEWCSEPINIELDHINGIRTDHRLDNLRMLCPNCHSQTNTYRSKNRVPSEKSEE